MGLSLLVPRLTVSSQAITLRGHGGILSQRNLASSLLVVRITKINPFRKSKTAQSKWKIFYMYIFTS